MQDGQGAGAGQATGNSEALRADIQQMLKDLSGDLKQLQAQLAATTADQPRPQAGTATDPQLYDQASSPLETTSGPALPIQLQTDTAPTSAQRPSSGVGRPSGEVSQAHPNAQSEDAQLSDEPLQEAPVDRQSVPPEYRSVFDRLRTTTSQQSER